MPVTYAEHKSFVPVRKKGKLPRETISAKYDLEYGSAEIEIHKDAIKPGQKVVIVDDLIATGGTVEAIIDLIEQLGGVVVKVCFVMELAGLQGRKNLSGYDVDSAIIMRENKVRDSCSEAGILFLCHRTAISYDIKMLRITETKCKIDMISEKH